MTMSPAEARPGQSFRKRLFGYDPAEVDDYLVRATATHEAVRAEVERLRAAEPLTRVGGDIATLLSTFAQTVSGMRDEAASEIERSRLEATDYAVRQRAEADRMVESARDRAQRDAEALLARARQDVASIAAQWSAVEASLTEASQGIAAALAALQRIQRPDAPVRIDIADHSGIAEREGEMAPVPPVPTVMPAGDRLQYLLARRGRGTSATG